jgi:vanillate O-demethylase monooxygenase subunit
MQAFQGEDAPMIEAQQGRLLGRSCESLRPMLLATDAAAVAVRRRMQRLLEAEAPAPG